MMRIKLLQGSFLSKIVNKFYGTTHLVCLIYFTILVITMLNLLFSCLATLSTTDSWNFKYKVLQFEILIYYMESHMRLFLSYLVYREEIVFHCWKIYK